MPALMSYGLPRKIRIVFIVQVVLVTLMVVAGAWLVSVMARQALFRELLREDATYYWERYAQDPSVLPPDTRRVRGIRVDADAAGKPGSTGLWPLQQLAPGFHDTGADQAGGQWLVWVEDGPGGRLYLLYERDHAQKLVLWVAVVPVLLTLLAIYLASWYAYRASRNLIVPVNWLARQVAQWDPGQPDASALDPRRLGPDVKGESRQLAIALHDMARRVGEHIQREHDFTRDASHELRTPLTVIRVATDVALADSDLKPRQARGLQRIARATADMEAVIESQLILARESQTSAQIQQVAVARLVEEEAGLAREQLAGRPVGLELEITGSPQLQTSERALRVVVRHLLENACLYTEQGHIDLKLDEAALEVSDTGIGMDGDALMRAFEPFYRVNPGNGSGPGLGLSITRRLCERFGWSIELESQPGQGTRATLRFAAVPTAQ